MQPAIKVERLSKSYRLGLTHAGSVRELVNDVVARLTGRSSPQNGTARGDADRVDAGGLFWALRDVSFEIQPGEVVGIIGRNGAGKSTLLKILSRITTPTAGRVEMRGRVASLLEVGTGFHPELTGRENVFLNGTILGMTRREIDAQFDAIVDFAGVEKFIDTPVKRYSSGMTVRLGFAVAAHLNPEILIVDEVLAVGDVEFQRRCLGKMNEVARSGRTVLFVSHNMATIRQLTALSIVLADGEVAFCGDTEDAVDVYLGQRDPSQSAQGVRQTEVAPDRVRLDRIVLSGNRPYLEQDAAICFSATLTSLNYSGRGRISMTLFQADGGSVGSCFSASIIQFSAGHQVTAEFSINNHYLAPGRYFFAVSVGTGDNHSGFEDFDSVTDVLHFEIVRPVTEQGGIAVWQKSWGPVRLPAPVLRHASEVQLAGRGR